MNHKLPPTEPEITPAEQAILEGYAKARHVGKQAESLKEEVETIISRIGKFSCEAGVLIAAVSTKYPIPSRAHWAGRIAVLEKAVERAEAAVQKNSIDPTLHQELAEAKAHLATANEQTAHLLEYHEVSEWMDDMETYFKATGVVIKQESPTVKYLIEARPAPKRKPAPKKAKAKD